jgi:serine/threonine protein phosphatase PrpC
VGGYERSEVASYNTVEVFKNAFNQVDQIADFKTFYLDCIDQACAIIDEKSADLPKDKKIGTTINVVLISHGVCECANIGDSRTYHYAHHNKK